MTKKIVVSLPPIRVLDSNVVLTDSQAFLKFEDSDITIPIKLLEEIDAKKNRFDSVGSNARHFVRELDSLRTKGSLSTGISLGNGKGTIKVKHGDVSLLPSSLSKEIADNVIIACALSEQRENPGREVIVVSMDINLRVKCDALGLKCEGFETDRIVSDKSEIYSGLCKVVVSDETVEAFFKGVETFLDREEFPNLHPHEFVILTSDISEKKTALCKFTSYLKPLSKVKEYKGKEGAIFGINAKNREQAMALDLLMNPEIPLVSLIGNSGVGKSLLTLASALEMTIEKEVYKRIIVMKPIVSIGESVGALPGSLSEKLSPWLGPISDNLKFLFGDDRTTLEMYQERGIIEMEAIAFLRGRSLPNSFIIIEEMQNVDRATAKSICSRVGENSKIVLLGDPSQCDAKFLDATNNGLVHVVEKFKDSDLSGHITLTKGLRSAVATLASKIL